VKESETFHSFVMVIVITGSKWVRLVLCPFHIQCSSPVLEKDVGDC
jgi:hypothetical protein